MPKGVPADPAFKQEVIKTIREEGLTIKKASEVFGVSESSVKHWLYDDTKGSEKNYIVQINQLKKKLDNAYRVIGKLTAEVDRPKG